MKVDEILMLSNVDNSNEKAVLSLEAQTEQALKGVDWDFDLGEIGDDRFNKGQKKIKIAESLVVKLNEVNQELALKLWKQYCPYAFGDSLPMMMNAE
jgi:hypothetical protein